MTEANAEPPSAGVSRESLIGKGLLIYQTSPEFEYCSNFFKDVPVILQFEQSPLIEVIREVDLNYASQFNIYHADGSYLAKVKGPRVFAVKGADPAIKIRQTSDTTICTLAGKTCFEIKHSKGDSYRLHAELYTPEGWFIKSTDKAPQIMSAATGKELKIGGSTLKNNTIKSCAIGVLVDRQGRLSIGVGGNLAPRTAASNEIVSADLTQHKG